MQYNKIFGFLYSLANLRVIKLDAMLNKMMTLAVFETPLSDIDMNDPVDLIPASTKLKTR